MKNKLIFLAFILAILPVQATAYTLLETGWLDSENYSITVEQGEIADYFVWVNVNTDILSYIVRYDDGDNFVVVEPHTVIENEWSYYTELTIDTSKWEPKTYTLLVSANRDGAEGTYDITKELQLTITEPVCENNPPNTPTNLMPENQATNINLNPTLSWIGTDPDGDDLTFDVYFGTNPNPTNRIANDISQEYHMLQTLNYDTTYYWKIVANDGELTKSSDISSFTTEAEQVDENNPPNAPTNPNPETEAINVDLNPLLTWVGTDPDGDALTYTVYFATTPILGPNQIVETTTNNYYQISNLDYNTIYFWGIVASDGEFPTPSHIWSFTTVDEDTPINHAPALEEIDNYRTRCGREFKLQTIATDQDNDKLFYMDNSNLFKINKKTGLIQFTPSCSDRGTHEIEITVIDEHGASDTKSFTLTIYSVSGGGGSHDDEEEEQETELIVKQGICIDDLDGDIFGIRTIIYKTLDPLTKEILSFETKEEVCLLKQESNLITGLITDDSENGKVILWVALFFLIITIPIAVYIYYKLAQLF